MGRIPDSLTLSVPMKRYHRGVLSEDTGEILREAGLSLYVNNSLLIMILCLPSHLEELVVGYLWTEGIIASLEEVVSCNIDVETGRADVWLDKTTETAVLEQMAATDNGDTVRLPEAMGRRALCGVKEPAYNCETVLKNANRLLVHSKLFRTTGNVHAVMLCRDDEILCCMEDVGRFSAFDKCLGYALRKGWVLEDVCAYTTGRVPRALVLKAIRTGIPMLVSRSAPTDAALDLARCYGVKVVGFARGDGMNVYC
ncbi:MAG: formate dehydrogenase accessory sulfurtransferase FdhD [Peptococcaceae bacterium]|nr:formate dehydrogenase accessory sulfurtransferase FdhD [Peptococcaceae bacterium]